MPLRSPLGRRRVEFELMEPRLMLSADGAAAVAPSLVPDDVALHLAGSISGSVFATTRSGGARQEGDAGISGVRIELHTTAGEVLAEVLTDEAGEFEFPALAPGVYVLRQVQPAGWLDGFEAAGSGGGHAASPNVISAIVVHAGAMLEGYAFAEIAAAAQAADAQEVTSPLIGFLPPLAVAWSRPAEWLAPPSVEPRASQSLEQPPPELHPAEPIFGGSSGIVEDRDAALEALSDDEEAEGEVAVQARRKRASSSLTQGGREAARLAVRDRAFDLHEITATAEKLEAGEAMAEDVVERGDRRAAGSRQPIAPGKSARKPAA
jgi:hypothetical protein